LIPLFFALAACRPTPVWPETPSDAACSAGGLPADESILRLTEEEEPRTALVWGPQSAGPHDVVVNLHEFRAEPRRQNHYSRWVPEAAARGMLLVGPDGRSATWNVGNGCCGKAGEKGYDDVRFLDDVAARIEVTGCTTGRVLATGIGNGGMMAERWACESDVPDAVVSVGGALQLPTCENARPIPIVHYHGEKDTMYPADGSKPRDDSESTIPVAKAIEAWKARNHATGAPVHTEQGALSCDRWDGDAPVVWCTVKGMADVWPGSAEWPVDPNVPLSDATVGALDAVIRPWWEAHGSTK
jgi:polyhydroxybutyrate depolymerase